ncbi:MAG TPA: hypothetical protein VFZ59_05715 [Verrucomicrobiae bacterium]|nr:hypothetical protein [Verrucomicrobiae bacterium]
MKILPLMLAIVALPLFAADEPLRDLDKIEAALKASPDDPMLHYRKCQSLFAKGKEQEAVDHGAVALARFKAANSKLAWMSLGAITNGNYIVRPYSFRVWTTNAEPKLVRKLDFELGYFNGELLSAAIGETTREGHLNFGVVDPKSDFATIKKKVLEIISK